MTDENTYLLQERAAIMEFDGGMTRHEAETKAAAEMRAQGDLFGSEKEMSEDVRKGWK
jgi:hypothetical protein